MKLLLLFLTFVLEWFACNGQVWKTTKSRGMAYQPVPKGVNPSTSGYLHDTDLFNTDFQALWGHDPRNGVVSRNDLLEMAARGVNSLHIYNWNSEPGERDHIPFLEYAATFQTPIKIWVPISNFLFQGQWNQRQIVLANIVNSTKTQAGVVHGSVFGWLIANEYDLHPDITAQMIAEVISIIATLDPDSNRPFSVPVSSAAGYNNNPNPGIGSLIELHDTLPNSIWSNRYIHSVNPFLPFDGLVTQILEPYRNQFDVWKENPVPLHFSEIGRSEFDVGSIEQTLELTDLACGFSYLQTVKSLNPYNFAGYYIFEYTREDWKGEAEELYGMNALGGDISDPAHPATTLKPAPGNDDIAAYPVNALGSIAGWINAFQVQQTGFSSSICDDFTKRHPSFAQAADDEMAIEELVSEEVAPEEELYVNVEEIENEVPAELVAEEIASGEETHVIVEEIAIDNEEIIIGNEEISNGEPTDEEIVIDEVHVEEDASAEDVVCDPNMSVTDLLQLVCDLQLRFKELETTHAASINAPTTPLTKFVISLIVVCAIVVLVTCAYLVKNRKRRQRSATDVELYRQITG